MTVEEIKELIHIVKDSEIAELEVQRGENRVRIKRLNGASAAPQEILLAPTPAVVASPAQFAPVTAASVSGAGGLSPAPDKAKGPPEVEHTLIKSPIVGTFYESPTPGTPAFVRVGDRVRPGQVLCIIESMKLMNEIEAEIAGTITAKLIENGQPVEYGEGLFQVKPD